MANCWHHSISSARKFGGKPEDYQKIHLWFDQSKGHIADHRHRALLHHSAGIMLAEQVFGPYIVNSDGKQVPTRFIGEQHVKEDLGYIPTLVDWIRQIPVESWMRKGFKVITEEI